MKLIFLYAVFSIVFTTISLPQNSFSILKGSAIIGITRNDTIWLGADSKLINFGIDKPAFDRCKIIKADNIVTAHLGVFKDYFTNIELDSIIINCLKSGPNIREIIGYLNATLIFTLQYISTLEVIGKRYSIGDTLQNYNTGLLIATNDNGRLVMYYFDYSTTVIDTIPKKSFLTKTEIIENHYFAEIGSLSYFQKGFRNIDEDIKVYKNWNIPNLINKLFEEEIQKFPDKIGYPISIIQITKNGIKWIQRGVCN